MKRFFMFFVIVSVFFVCGADEHDHGNWYSHGSMWGKDVRNVIGGKFDKPVLLEFGKYWCAGYRNFAHNTLESDKFIDFAQRHLKLVSLDPNIYKNLADFYKVSILPTYIVLDAFGNEVDRIENYAAPEIFVEKIKKIIYGQNNFLDLKKKYKSGKLSISEHVTLGEKFFQRKMYDSAQEVLDIVIFEDQYNFRANLIMGHISLIRKNMVQSDFFYNNASKDGERKGEVLYYAGINAYMNRFHKEAGISLQAFADFYKKKKDRPDYFFNGYYYLILSNIFAEKFKDGEANIAQAEKLFPDRKSALGQLKIMLFNAKQKADTLSHNDEHFHEGCGGATAQ